MNQPQTPTLKENQFLFENETVTVNHFKSEYGLKENEWEYQSVGKTTCPVCHKVLTEKVEAL